jgi:hypothetical protein
MTTGPTAGVVVLQFDENRDGGARPFAIDRRARAISDERGDVSDRELAVV